MTKIGFFPGLQFQCSQLLEIAASNLFEFELYSGSPKLIAKSNSIYRNGNAKFCPLPLRTLTRLMRYPQPNQFKYLDVKFYGLIAEHRAKNANLDIVHCWATFASEVFKSQKNSIRILDRPCPHVLEQQNQLEAYMNARQLLFKRHDNWFIERQLEEYEMADYILVPSKRTLKSFEKHGLAKKTIIAPIGPNIFPEPVSVRSVQSNDSKKEEIVFGSYASNWKRQGLYDLLKALEVTELNWKLVIRAEKNNLIGFPWQDFNETTKSKVSFMPYFKSIFEYFDQIDVLASTAAESGFGMIAVEALMYEKTVVCSPEIGALDVIGGFSNCVVTESLNTKDLSTALVDSAEISQKKHDNAHLILSALSKNKSKFESVLKKVWQA